MENTSGYKPLGHAVLVKHYESKEQLSSTIVIPDHVKNNHAMMDQRVIIVEAGPEAWLNEQNPRAVPGDKVLISKMAGHIIREANDGQVYRLVRDDDVFCKIVDGE